MGVKGRFLDQIEEIEWQLRKSVRRMEGVLILRGQNHIHRGTVFLRLDLFGGVRMTLRLKLKKELRRLL